MAGVWHRVRDGIHGFVEFNHLEKRLIDSRPFQRLRDIHQLAMCFHVYPGATHRRFEHSLGVMDVAGRIFDAVFEEKHYRFPEEVRQRIQERLTDQSRLYWRSVTRIAALLHDIGHLPFSHAAEDLLPEGWDHERLTVELIRNSEIATILSDAEPGIKPENVIDLCWSAKSRQKVEPKQVLEMAPWQTILNEIITGNTFGADRIDYLLRDSYHAGVAYGHFDPDRLIHGLRMVIVPESEQLGLALDIRGVHAAEALLLARYFMYSQVYFHDVRRAYDVHLRDFLKAWLPTRYNDGLFPTDWSTLLELSDSEVQVALWRAASGEDATLKNLAERLVCRKHFRTVYSLIAQHKEANPNIMADIQAFLWNEFEPSLIRVHQYGPKSELNDFHVVTEGGALTNSFAVSAVIRNVPGFDIGFVFADAAIASQARKRVSAFLADLLPGNVGETTEPPQETVM